MNQQPTLPSNERETPVDGERSDDLLDRISFWIVVGIAGACTVATVAGLLGYAWQRLQG